MGRGAQRLLPWELLWLLHRGRMLAVGWGPAPVGPHRWGDTSCWDGGPPQWGHSSVGPPRWGGCRPLGRGPAPRVVQPLVWSSPGGTMPAVGRGPAPVGPRVRFPFKDPVGAAAAGGGGGGGSAGRARPPRRAPAAIVPSPWRPRRPPAPFTCKAPDKGDGAGPGRGPPPGEGGGGCPATAGRPHPSPRGTPCSLAGTPIPPRGGMPRLQPGAPGSPSPAQPSPVAGCLTLAPVGSRSPADRPGRSVPLPQGAAV